MSGPKNSILQELSILRRAVFSVLMALALCMAAVGQLSAEPLSEQDLVSLIELEADPDTLAATIKDKGYAGPVDDLALKKLLQSGASPVVILALKKHVVQDIARMTFAGIVKRFQEGGINSLDDLDTPIGEGPMAEVSKSILAETESSKALQAQLKPFTSWAKSAANDALGKALIFSAMVAAGSASGSLDEEPREMSAEEWLKAYGKLTIAEYMLEVAEKEEPAGLAHQRELTAAEMRANATFTNSLGLEMIWVEPGTVVPDKESIPEECINEFREITITEGYYLGKTEVTQTQWHALMQTDESRFAGPANPVENVTWPQAMEFCKRLTEKESAAGNLRAGYHYTLPTEAQWEYACRAGSTGEYAGDLDAMAWYQSNSAESTHAVATKQANAWGFHDMHGNVWEWCLDVQSEGRARRGGSFSDVDDFLKPCRSGFRFWGTEKYRIFNQGFRPALVRVEQKE